MSFKLIPNFRDRLLELDKGDGRRCFSGALAAGQVHQLYQKHKGTLFNLNIRNYVGDTRTNKDIVQTAISEPENFYYYNNGISAIARKVTIDEVGGKTVLKCADFSIINGAQTFRSISKAHTKNKLATAKLLVPLRVTEFDFARGKGDAFLEKITKFNNTQNAIKISDFRSNDPVQTSITNYVANMPAFEGKKYAYRSKRSQMADRSKIFIGLDDFCRTVHAFKFAPADILGGTSYLYDTSAKGGYTKLFGDPSEPLSEATFREYFGIWLVCSKAREFMRTATAQRDASLETADDQEQALLTLEKNALERRFHAFYALGEVLREACKLNQKDEGQILAGFSRPQWQSDPKKIAPLETAFEIASGTLTQAYQLASASPDFMHRNFFRGEDFTNILKKALLTRRGQIKTLVL